MGGAAATLAHRLAGSFLFEQSFIFDVKLVSRQKIGRENCVVPYVALIGFVLAPLGAYYGCQKQVFDMCRWSLAPYPISCYARGGTTQHQHPCYFYAPTLTSITTRYAPCTQPVVPCLPTCAALKLVLLDTCAGTFSPKVPHSTQQP